MHCISLFRKLLVAASIGTVFVFSSCNPTKNLKDGQYFFTGYKIKVDNKSIDKGDLQTYIRQKPNRKFFFLFRLQMGFYRLGENWNSAWLKKIGEEPVALDTVLVGRSASQLKFYMDRKGYFNSIVGDTIIYKKKKASVIYSIQSGTPYTIRSIEYTSKDTSIYRRLLEDEKNSLLHPGMIYDEDVLDKERERFTEVMKSQGYYFFTKQFISYSADSALQNYEMNLKMNISRLQEDTSANGSNAENHHQYHINRMFIRTDYDPKSVEVAEYDTVNYKNYFFLTNKKNPYQRYRKDALLRAIFISSGDLFSIRDIKYTYSRLTDLNVFRFVNIRFNEVPRNDVQQQYLLDMNILLTPAENQNFTIETEGTHNAGTLGIAGNISYNNKNTFKGAELLELKLKGGLEFQKSISGEENTTALFFNTYEIGPEISLNVKKLLLIDPWFRNSSRKWNPQTRIAIAENYQSQPDYNRSVGSFNYSWKIKTTLPHQYSFDLFDVNFVDVTLTQSFIDKLKQINDKGLFYSYSDHLITSGRFNYTYNNQQSSGKNYEFIRTYFEASGLILSLLSDNVSFIDKDSLGFRQAFGLNYSQYFKVEVDARHYQNFAANNILVYRADVGIGVPRVNSIALPFEKSFYGGGSNSLRAWRFRSLGPGSYVNTFNIEQTGDIKIELNAELRSPFVKRFSGMALEGAAFVDAGNIWLWNSDSERTGGELKIGEILPEFAIGTGLGIRFNFNYFIFRVDAAVKFRDPSRPESERWVYIFGSNPQKFAARDINFNLGIGYPF